METRQRSNDPSDLRLALGLIAALGAVFVWSGIDPHDRLTWLLEVAPVLLGVAALAAVWRRFRFSSFALGLMFVHAVILLIGGHYTYAEVPAFNWLRDALDLSRNHYDRVGHFAQGFFPAIYTREVLLRTSPLRRGGWLFFVATSICLAMSAFWELLEWWTALVIQEGADAFLGTQGDPWDTQTDMFLALIGAMLAQWLLSGRHDQSMKAIGVESAESR